MGSLKQKLKYVYRDYSLNGYTFKIEKKKHNDLPKVLTTVSISFCQGYMMDLTSNQGRVGKVLQLGSQLIGSGKLSEDEETEVQEQMNLLNSRWECLRVASMEKQSK